MKLWNWHFLRQTHSQKTPQRTYTLLTALPEGFLPRHQWPEYVLACGLEPRMHPVQVGVCPVGRRWGFWPLFFEEYVSDIEPDLSMSDPDHTAPNRLVIWRTQTRAEKVPGWFSLSKSTRTEGFAELAFGTDYAATWSDSGRRDRRRWRKDFLGTKYELVPISYEVFEAAYVQSPIGKKLKRLVLDFLERRAKTLEHLELWGARHRATGEIVAGMATVQAPSCAAAYYEAGFVRPEWQRDPVMLGLVDRWFASCQDSGLRFLHLGAFWQKGSPSDWKGFSLFKSRFGTKYISYPPIRIRFVRGKLF